MTTAALIACSNGYGHIRRTAAIAAGLAARDVAVTWFAKGRAAESFLGWPGSRGAHRRIEIVDFDTQTSAAKLRSGAPEALQWHRRLPEMSGFDLVLSDNLPEILEIRGDAILCGHFFWHDVLDGLPEAYVARAQALIDRHRPVVISSDIFTMPVLERNTRLLRVGLFDLAGKVASSTPRRNLLIACGRGGEIKDDMKRLVASLAEASAVPFDTVFVEPDLMVARPPRWMAPAALSPDMYAGLLAAICRPGIGTVTDCLIAGARVFALGEAWNREMVHNSSRIAELGLGQACADASDAIRQAWAYAGDAPAHRRHLEAVARHCRPTGADEAVAYMLGLTDTGAAVRRRASGNRQA